MQHAVLLGHDNWMRFNNRSLFGELELSHHTPSGVRAHTINPVACGGGFHLRYDGAVGVTSSDEPQLLAVNSVRSNGSQALTGHYPVDMLPQSDLPFGEEHFVVSGRQVIPLVEVSNLEPGNIPGVAHAPLMCVSLDALQHDGRPSGPSSGSPGVTPISDVMSSPLTAATATASPLPALLERLTSCMTIDARIPTMPGRSTLGVHRSGKHREHQARSDG